MAKSIQTYGNHRRLIPLYHVFALPIIGLNVVVEVMRLNKYKTPYHVFLVLFALALLVVVNALRGMANRVQDRVIRLEERSRLSALLPEDLRGRVNDLTPSQLVGLRFASDEEAPVLARRCLDGELTKADQVKKEVKSWRADTLRA